MPANKSRSSAANPRLAVLTYFSAYASLPQTEAEALRTLIGRLTPFAAGSEILSAGALLDTPWLVASGWVCRATRLPDGRRQILDFYLPGDLVAFSSRPGAKAAAAYISLTRSECAPAGDLLRNIQDANPRWPVLAEICRTQEQQIEIRVLQQIVRNGRQTAYERVGHLLLEFYGRLRLSGLAPEGSFTLPLTQEILAEAVGLSTVHMNRTMQHLRRDKVIRTEDGLVTILNTPALLSIAGRLGTPNQPGALQREIWATQDLYAP
ncbi:MAG: Crp/Fnr family transcriptional regulator [Alphaproteobacteria bacterium]|nr:Crp/Fnr family transcriptional regulator [Alphaproteobacteria bacterium]